MFSLFGDSSEGEPTPDVFYLVRYLDLPIVRTDLDTFDSYKRQPTDGKLPILKSLPPPLSRPLDAFCIKCKIDVNCLAEVDPREYRDLWASQLGSRSDAHSLLTFAKNVCDPILGVIPACLLDRCGVTAPAYNTDILTLPLIDALRRLLWWNSLLDVYDRYRSTGGRGHQVFAYDERIVMMSTRLCAISSFEGLSGPRVFTYEQFLGWKDAMYVRFNIALACSQMYPSTPMVYTLISASIAWQELCLTRYGNQGYELAKSTESLSKAYMGRLAKDPVHHATDAYSMMVTKHLNKERKLRIPGVHNGSDIPLAYLYQRTVLERASTLQELVEVFGCQKAISHPLIDVRRSGRSAAKEARDVDTTTVTSAQELRATWCRIFTEGYIRKHHKWPILKNTQPGTQLHDFYRRGILSFHRTSTPLSDWVLVSFGKMFDFDYYPNFLDVVDDKSINVPYSERESAWDPTMLTTTQRRLLLEVLSRHTVDHKAMIQHMENDTIPRDHKSVAITPKEREYKLQARMFAMLVLDIRNPATIGEANLANTILPYIPQLTMADDKLTVHQRFLDLTRPLGAPELIRVFIELDLARWNLRWRALCIDMIGMDMNDLFGMKRMYTWIHKFFAECMVYVRSGTNRPPGLEHDPPPESDLLWYKHLGGFEGLAQKLWSIATVAMIARAVDDLPISYSMTAQGDNVVLTITTTRDFSMSLPDQLLALKTIVLERCSTYSAAVNQDLKPEECLDSVSTVTYSKAIYINGVDYPTTIKSLSRLFPTASVDFPSPETFLRSIFAGSLAAAETSKEGIRCYYTGMLSASIASGLMARSCGPYTADVKSSGLGVNSTVTRHFLTIPSELGGYSTAGFYQYLYRGGGDPLSKSLASWWMLQEYYIGAQCIIRRLTDDSTYVNRPDLESLIKDPYSLPLRRSAKPEDAVAVETLGVLKLFTKNKAIQDVLALCTDDYKTSLIQTLSQLVPFNPVIAHDLYDCSLLGTQESLSKMFITTRSIQVLSRTVGSGSITGELTRAARQGLHEHVRMQRTLTSHGINRTSLYTLVSQARSRWSTDGFRVENITSYLPCDFPMSVEKGGFPTEVVVYTALPTTDPRYTRGQERAYLGTRTREKRADHGYRIIGHSFAASALSTLQRIYSWSDQSHDIGLLIDWLSLTRSTLAITPYSAFLPTIVGGSAAHRYASRVGHSSAHIMGQSTFATHCAMNSDNAGFLSGAVDDYPVMFQEFFLYGIALLDLHAANTRDRHYYELSICIGDKPLQPLIGDRFVCKAPGPLPPLPKMLPRLIQDPDIHIRRISGVDDSCAIPPVYVDSVLLKFQAVCAVVRSKLGGIRRTMGVLDHTISRLSLPLGVLEYAGMGIRLYLEACASVVLDLVNSAVNSKVSAERRNAGIGYLILRYGRVVIQPLLGVVCHPKLSADTTVVKLGLGATLSYRGSSVIQDALLGEFSRILYIGCMTSTSYYHTRPVASFASDTLDDYVHVIISAIRRQASLLVILGLCDSQESNCMIGSTILVANDPAHVTVDNRITALHYHLRNYTCTPSKRYGVNEDCQRACAAIAMSRTRFAIRGSRLSAEEVVRYYRADTPVPVPPTALMIGPLPVCDFSGILVRPMIAVDRTYALAQPKWLIHYYRNIGRLAPFGSGAYLSWQPFAPLFTGKQVLIVGSGLGALAALALTYGAQRVCGHDLQCDLPPVTRAERHIPPLVALTTRKHLYAQSRESSTTSGDWFDPTVSASLLRRFPPTGTVCIDLSSDKGSHPDVILPIIKFSLCADHLLRCMTTEYGHGKLLALITVWTPVYGVYIIHQGDGYAEKIYWFGRVRSPLYHGHLLVEPLVGAYDLTSTQLDRVVRLSPIGSVDQISLGITMSILTAHLGGPVGNCPKDSFKCALTLFSDFLSGATSRPEYDEWTAVLHCAVVCDWCLNVSSTDEVSVLTNFANQGVYELTTYTGVYVQFSLPLLYTLTTHACRVKPYINRQYPSWFSS